MRRTSLVGMSFGEWTVSAFAYNGADRHARWECKCSCGTVRIVSGHNLKGGQSVSCGCHRPNNKRHGETGSSLHSIWKNMIGRCSCESNTAYGYYGGRGITVCERWLVYENFRDDMGERPSPNHSVDRINNNGAYSPENCRWATREQQGRNKRNNIMVAIGTEVACIAEWCDRLHLNRDTVYMRLHIGWTPMQAILAPPNTQRKRITDNSLGEWAASFLTGNRTPPPSGFP